jgi:mono/diheme cytochrome c family protein
MRRFHFAPRTAALLATVVFGIVPFLPAQSVGGPPVERERASGDANNGRQLFHGKGICHYCHGQNGDPENLPQLKPETLRTVRGLRPQPPDLRRPKELKLKSDSQRFLIIRDGHEGTGMLPDTTLSNQDIRDVMAYLATLRATHKEMSK